MPTMVAVDRDPVGSYPVAVVRRRGTLLLGAFLAAVVASGGGSVSAPWLPQPRSVEARPDTVGHVLRLGNGAAWLRRME